MELSESLSLNDLKKLPAFLEVSDFIRYFPGAPGVLFGDTRLSEAGRFGWNTGSLLYGLERLEEVCSKGSCLYRLYTDNANPTAMERDVSLMFFPKTKDTGKKPFIIICPGGAFISVGSVAEGFPIAAAFNALGYDVFILTYSVGLKATMPAPLKDLAAAVAYVLSHRKEFGVSEKYIVGGFSAGGYMTALWGSSNHGFKAYGLPAPAGLFPVYAITDPSIKCNDQLYSLTCDIMFSRKAGPEVYEEYNVCRHVSPDYPPSFIVCGSNDTTVSPANSQILKAALDALGIPAVLEVHENASHGFGDGRGTDAFGWIDRAGGFFDLVSETRQ